jgi:hypothetical protein
MIPPFILISKEKKAKKEDLWFNLSLGTIFVYIKV